MTRATVFVLGAGLSACLVEVDAPPSGEVPAPVQAAFDRNCVRDGCHDAGTARNGLSLEPGDSDAIIGGDALGSDLPLVEPGSLDGSYLAQKILDGDIVGSSMPPGGGDPEDLSVILGWIAGIDFDDDEPSFENTVWPVLRDNCSCHRDPDDMMGSGPLQLPDADTAYMNLVGVPAQYDMGIDYVRPGSLAESYVWLAVTGVASGGSIRMPFGTDGLPGKQLIIIRDWILAGAPP